MKYDVCLKRTCYCLRTFEGASEDEVISSSDFQNLLLGTGIKIKEVYLQPSFVFLEDDPDRQPKRKYFTDSE